MSAKTVRRQLVSGRLWAMRGDKYTDQFVGLTVRHTTWDGTEMVGQVESFDHVGRPVIRFPDGRWATGDKVLTIITDRGSS